MRVTIKISLLFTILSFSLNTFASEPYSKLYSELGSYWCQDLSADLRLMKQSKDNEVSLNSNSLNKVADVWSNILNFLYGFEPGTAGIPPEIFLIFLSGICDQVGGEMPLVSAFAMVKYNCKECGDFSWLIASEQEQDNAEVLLKEVDLKIIHKITQNNHVHHLLMANAKRLMNSNISEAERTKWTNIYAGLRSEGEDLRDSIANSAAFYMSGLLYSNISGSFLYNNEKLEIGDVQISGAMVDNWTERLLSYMTDNQTGESSLAIGLNAIAAELKYL